MILATLDRRGLKGDAMGEYVMVGQLVIVNKIGTAVAVRFHPDWRSWWNQQFLVHELSGILVPRPMRDGSRHGLSLSSTPSQ